MGLALMTNRNYNSVVQGKAEKQKVTIILILQPPTLTQLANIKKQAVAWLMYWWQWGGSLKKKMRIAFLAVSGVQAIFSAIFGVPLYNHSLKYG